MNTSTVSEKPQPDNNTAYNVLFGAGSLKHFSLPELTRFCRDWPGVNEDSASAVIEQHPQIFEKDSEGKFHLRPGGKEAIKGRLEELYDGPKSLNPFSRD